MGILGDLLPVERLTYASDIVCVGEIRCHPDHPLFGGGHPSNGHCVAFPRSTLWVQHEGGPRRVEDPSVAGLYNRGEPYKRWPIAREGDCADWLAFSTETIAEVIAATGRRMSDRMLGERPFQAGSVAIDGAIYLAQRRFFLQLARDEQQDALAVEERSLRLLDSVMQAAYGCQSRRADATAHYRRSAVEHARAILGLEFADRPSLHSIATRVGCSPFHLCRAFRHATGMTMTQYRTELRLRVALEPVAAGADLTMLALELGFCSHSHFTAAFRRAFGLSPSSFRRANAMPKGM